MIIYSVSSSANIESKWNIKGKVVDAQTSELMPYVTVTLNNASDSSLITGIITDDKGEFFISKVKKVITF